jgi:hypothetical protein
MIDAIGILHVFQVIVYIFVVVAWFSFPLTVTLFLGRLFKHKRGRTLIQIVFLAVFAYLWTFAGTLIFNSSIPTSAEANALELTFRVCTSPPVLLTVLSVWSVGSSIILLNSKRHAFANQEEGIDPSLENHVDANARRRASAESSKIEVTMLLFVGASGAAVMAIAVVLFFAFLFIIGLVLLVCGLLGVLLFRIMKRGTFKRRYSIVAPIVLILIALGTVMFASAYLHQVQTGQTFRVTVSWFDSFSGEYMWGVHIEQLSFEELKDARVIIDRGESPFPSHFNPTTADGHAQQNFGHYPQPTNITIVWSGGSETFLFNHYPFDGLDPNRVFTG